MQNINSKISDDLIFIISKNSEFWRMWRFHFVSFGDYGPVNCQHQIVGKKSVSKTYVVSIDVCTLIPLLMPFQNPFHSQ